MLRLQKATTRTIVRQASEHPEVEVCGLVWASEHGQTVYPLPNVHPDPRQYYETGPSDVQAAFAAMDRNQGEPLAWYHSHPGGKPDPSETDMLGAFNTGMYYLIAYPRMPTMEYAGALVSGATRWQLSAWECLEPGLLLSADYLEVS